MLRVLGAPLAAAVGSWVAGITALHTGCPYDGAQPDSSEDSAEGRGRGVQALALGSTFSNRVCVVLPQGHFVTSELRVR